MFSSTSLFYTVPICCLLFEMKKWLSAVIFPSSSLPSLVPCLSDSFALHDDVPCLCDCFAVEDGQVFTSFLCFKLRHFASSIIGIEHK